MEPAMTFEVMPLGRRGRFGMTPLQQRVYLAIVRLIESGFCPSYRDIAEASGLYLGQITAQVEELEIRGWIVKGFGYRAIALTEPVMRDLVPISVPANEVIRKTRERMG